MYYVFNERLNHWVKDGFPTLASAYEWAKYWQYGRGYSIRQKPFVGDRSRVLSMTDRCGE